MESSPGVEMTPVTPVHPIAGYIGGKRNLSRRLVARIDAVPHRLYAEPFVGMGGVFLRRTRRPRVEVINDISQDVTTLFRILQRHHQSFLDELKWRFTSRAEFERLTLTDPATLTDLERAARFLFLQRTAFGGKVVGRNFGVDRQRSRFALSTVVPMVEDLHERLQDVVIERLPYLDFIRRYDSPETLFYLDPPYAGSEGDYGPDVFAQQDFALLADALNGIAGRFILSINDTSATRACFAAFAIDEVEVTYRLSGGATPARELIVSSRPRS